ncbi:stigma-specific STIG1-like protein 2 [Diospyros lotus]|uniref:stigma-specific STIG1-like protein 2 n=1 Tax=Diospyros lotus TaxID=55363 RepID=UPI0022581353|nr:stigma-specific STIG1-like protein 2 [Diospyros lotus]
MKPITAIIMIAMAAASIVTLGTTYFGHEERDQKPSLNHSIDHSLEKTPALPAKRVSRFLVENKNPRAADHCHKDHEVCHLQDYGYNSTCCNNKCVDLATDHHNCGACKNKCPFPEDCCRGQCVYLPYDKRHCGRCNNRCEKGLLCIYGMCDYP